MLTEERIIPYHGSDLTGKKVLVLAPHPDDETIGCGGSLILHAEAGDPVKVVFLTNGARGDVSGKIDRSVYIEQRRIEAEKACACLGAKDLEFWGYEDRSLAGSRGAVARLIDLLADYRPQLVYAPSPVEIHPDHRAASFLLYDAVRGSHADFQVAFYEIGQPMSVNLLVDTSRVMDRRVRALEAYESQLRERPYKDVSVALSRYRSITLPPPAMYAEGFLVCETGLLREAGLFSLPFQGVHRLAPRLGERGPLVSVIVRTKDRPELLAEALKSIARQSYANLEVVVVNDGGRDVRDLLPVMLQDVPFIYIVHEENRGRSQAANSGLEAARGEYINFLDDDDVLYPEHVETLVGAALPGGEKVVYSGASSAYYEGPPQDPGNCARKETIFNQPFDPDLFLFASHIPIMSVLFHRDVFKDLKGFDTTLDLFEDWELLIRASRRFGFKHVDKVTAEYRFYGARDASASHRAKYDYNEAQAELFNRVVPHLTGRAWIKFLESGLPYALCRNKDALQRQIAPVISEIRGKEEALSGLQEAHGKALEEIAAKSAELEGAAERIRDLQARTERMEAFLHEILGSKGWAWLSRFREWKTRVLPGRPGERSRGAVFAALPRTPFSQDVRKDGCGERLEIVSPSPEARDVNIAVVAHLYYEDLADLLLNAMRHIPLPFDLYLSTRPGEEGAMSQIFWKGLRPGKIVVKAVPNRGFDIQPFLVAFGSDIARYDVVCKVHGKKSATRSELEGWGGYLLDNLLGSTEIVSQILESFESDKRLGLLFPDYFSAIRPFVNWGSNWEIASRLSKRLNISLEEEKDIDFPAGSMFWCRPKALEPLLALSLEEDDFEAGAEHCEDGTMAHALERLFVPVVEHQGYRWKKVLYAPESPRK